MENVINEVLHIYREYGDLRYGTEAVTQLEHALQTATLAVEQGASSSLIAAALLHDIGHIKDSPEGRQELEKLEGGRQSLDDRHEENPYRWLLQNFGRAVADPVRLHVVAKRYLCTREPSYEKALSPTSHQSFLDQGGCMNDEELAEFEAEKFCDEALELRRWDDAAKDPDKQLPEIESFVPHLEAALL